MPRLFRPISAVGTAITSLFVARRRLEFWHNANLVPQAGIQTQVIEANEVIAKLRTGQILDAVILEP